MKNIKKSYFIIFGLIVLAVVCFSTSYAIFSNTKEEHGKLNIVAGNLNYKIESSELDSDSITLPANTSKEIRIKLTSLNEVSSKYELYYILDKTNDKVSVGYSKDTKDNVLGTVEANKNKIITIVIRNDSDTSSKITFKVLGGLLNNDLALKGGNSLNKEVALCNYEKGYVWNFDYTGGEQEFTTPCSGKYKLETWGAQGGVNNNDFDGKIYMSGYGGYSSGVIDLNNKKEISINVGEQGKISQGYGTSADGSYNGGGNGFYVENSGCASNGFSASGGGATHIALSSGVLSNLEDSVVDILIVSGGGGGAHYCNAWNGGFGGHGGGYIGGNSYNNLSDSSAKNGYGIGGTQTTGGLTLPQNQKSAVFGKSVDGSSTGGGGFYGGGNSDSGGAGGGSGYIGNTSLYNKVMYCYNCEESTEKSTKTISTTCTSETPTENCSKQGNGYARITYLGN